MAEQSSPVDYATEETVIPQAGVVRCCLETVAVEHLGKRVALGATSKCAYCGRKFVLVAPSANRPAWQKPDNRPQWLPEEWATKKPGEET